MNSCTLVNTRASLKATTVVTAKGGDTTVVAFGDALVFTKVHEFTECYGATGSWGAPGEKAT